MLFKYLELFIIPIFLSKYFDFKYPKSLQANPLSVNENSMFGFGIQFSKTKNIFYVSAPNGLFPSNPPKQVGSVYECNLNNLLCFPKFFPSNSGSMQSKIQVRAMFGYSFTETSDRNIEICGPNIRYVIEKDYYCSKYSTKNYEYIKGGDIPYRRIWGNKLSFDNYGTFLKQRNSTSANIFIVGQFNYIYSSASEFLSEYDHYLVIASQMQETVNVSLTSIPGNSILLNYNNKIIYLIVPYPDNNMFLGAFAVFNYDLILQQSVFVNNGTYGQQFGYSGDYGSFNNIGCIDVIFGAPFYSEKYNQGAVFVFMCQNNENKFSEFPIIILGDDIPFAYFGTSTINVGDRNKDNIEDIAILAPFYDNNIPQIYIYNPSNDGKYFLLSYKISLNSQLHPFIGKIPMVLSSKFDIDENELGELAISYPLENKFLYVFGIKYIDLYYNFTFASIEKSDENLKEILLANETEGKKYKIINLNLKINFDHMQDDEIRQRPSLRYKLSIISREYSFFDIGGYPQEIERYNTVEYTNESIDLSYNVLYWLQPISLKPFTIILLEMELRQNSLFCHSHCVKTDKLIYHENIIPSEYLCTDKSLAPDFKLNVNTEELKLDIGNINDVIITIEIKKSGYIISNYPTLVIESPHFMEIKNISFYGITEENIFYQHTSYDESNRKKIEYVLKKFFEHSENIIFNISVELKPVVGIKDSSIDILTYDSMYLCEVKEQKSIKLVFGENPIILTLVSLPKFISIPDKNSVENFSIDKINIFVNIFNKQEFYRLMDVIIILELPIYNETYKLLEVESEYLSPTVSKENCTVEICDYCKINFLCFSTIFIHPNDQIYLSLNFIQSKNTSNLVNWDIKSFDFNLIITYSGISEIISQNTSIQIGINVIVAEPYKNIIPYIIVATILGIIILCIFISFFYKKNAINVIKSYIKDKEMKKLNI